VWLELHIFAWASKAEVYNCRLPHSILIVACYVLRGAVLLQVWNCKGDWLDTWLFNSHLYRMAQNKIYETFVTLLCCVVWVSAVVICSDINKKMPCGDRLRLDYKHLTLFWAVHAEGMHDICLAQQCVRLLTSVAVFSCLWVVAAHQLCWLDSSLLCMKCVCRSVLCFALFEELLVM